MSFVYTLVNFQIIVQPRGDKNWDTLQGSLDNKTIWKLRTAL